MVALMYIDLKNTAEEYQFILFSRLLTSFQIAASNSEFSTSLSSFTFILTNQLRKRMSSLDRNIVTQSSTGTRVPVLFLYRTYVPSYRSAPFVSHLFVIAAHTLCRKPCFFDSLGNSSSKFSSIGFGCSLCSSFIIC